MTKRILTGIKPTGQPHIGNYFGAIKPAIELSKDPNYECFYFIADYHALNILENREQLRENLYDVACTWLACGLDPNKVIFYRQSDIHEVFELNWILCNVTPKGLMNRAHAYKAKVEQNLENNEDADAGVNMGLYNYPILMAADILVFNSNLVPVGLDQKQHVEMARDIANSFNYKYGNTFIEPAELIDNNVATLVGLDGRKMSKSYGNIIPLFSSAETLKKTIKRIVTDSRMPGEPKPLDCTLNKIYKLFANKQQAEEFDEKLTHGLSWGEAKEELFEVANTYLAGMREKYEYYQAHHDIVDNILKEGANKARKIAEQVLAKVRKKIGADN